MRAALVCSLQQCDRGRHVCEQEGSASRGQQRVCLIRRLWFTKTLERLKRVFFLLGQSVGKCPQSSGGSLCDGVCL